MKFVGRTPVSLEHPKSLKRFTQTFSLGWESEPLANDFPSCANGELSAWAVVSDNPALIIPLIGTYLMLVQSIDVGPEYT
ncbi:MAG: hypothetical protein VCB60_02075 [Alphaproteobacteria bacterium]